MPSVLMHMADKRDHVDEYVALDDIRRGISGDSHGAMRLSMWHADQNGVALCLLQLLDRIDKFLTWTI